MNEQDIIKDIKINEPTWNPGELEYHLKRRKAKIDSRNYYEYLSSESGYIRIK